MTIACGSALVGISFLPLWATYRIPGLGIVAPTTVHQNAWTAYGFGMQLALLLTLVCVAYAFVLGLRPHLPIPDKELVLLGLCILATVLLASEAFLGPEGSSKPNGYGISRGVLLFAGLGLACGMTYGGNLVRRNRRGAGGSSPT